MKTLVRPFFSFSFLIVLGASIAFFLANYEEIRSPCLPPLHYSISPIDSRFQLTQEQAILYAQEAESIWETPLEKDLFVYDPTSTFRIQFTFDKRQENTFHAQNLETSIESTTTQYEDLVHDLDITNERTQKLIDRYNSLTDIYTKDLTAYNKEIAQWNQKGGAPEAVFKQLEKERDDLEEQREVINALIKQVNELSSETNTLVSSINETADTINTNVDTYNTLFEDMPTFDKGVYHGEGITLYQFTSKEDFILTLAHEFGHALGVNHIENPSALMNPFIEEQSLDPIQATLWDMQAAQTSCRFN